MSNSKKMLSLLMAVIIMLLSVTSSTAIIAPEDSASAQVQWIHKIDEDLLDKMAQASSDEKIPVYVWYEDINQDEVDELTTKATGLTPESCSVIKEFPSQNLIASLQNDDKDASKQMDDYLLRTEVARKSEQSFTSTYVSKRRSIAVEKYIRKSQEIKNQLSISDNNVIFNSEFVPVIIVQLTKNQIENAAKHNSIYEIGLYTEYEVLEPSTAADLVYTDNGIYAKNSMKLYELYEVYGLSGNGVNVGLVESNIPGVFSACNADLGFDYSDITVVQSPDNPIYPGVYDDSNVHDHSNNTVRVMMHNEYGISPNINLFVTQCNFIHLEEMLKLSNEDVINVIEVNISFLNKIITSNNIYTVWDKYFDHIVANHNITVVVAGGNETSHYGEVISSPGMGYNVITVGAYDNMNNNNESDDIRKNYTWRNSYIDELQNNNIFGCEKPDVIMPVNFFKGGTSEASPALTSQIALMLELKPSLSLQPQAIKAIILASCHRKVNVSEASEPSESMEQGITERQGAGAPDAWAMISIVCQGTYGVGELYGNSHTINIVQPPYGANYMNVSIAWLRENGHLDNGDNGDIDCSDPDNISIGEESDLNLQVLRSDGEDTLYSSLEHSSTEMCYLSLSNTHFNYQIKINNNSVNLNKVRYGYAWSTNKMRASDNDISGVYYIKNCANERYISYNNALDVPKAEMKRVTTLTSFNKNHEWIINNTNDYVNIIPGNGLEMMYLDQSTNTTGTSLVSQLSENPVQIRLLYNTDGTVSFINVGNDRILSYSSSNLVWNAFDSENQTPSNSQKWYLEKVNYLKGDVNADGEIDSATTENVDNEEVIINQEVITLRNYLAKREIPTNINNFLADVDGDGEASIMDISRLLYIAESQFNY